MTPFSILFENSEILIVNKPNGVSVQGGKGISHPLDVELSRQVGYKVFLVHRLDKETSGLLVVAKSQEAAAKWTNLFFVHGVQKEYYALCIGKPLGKEQGTLIDTIQTHGKNQSAELKFKVMYSFLVQVFTQKEESTPTAVSLSLVSVTLGTGRMHQIRIQLAKAKAPIVADDQHGDFKLNKALRKAGYKKLCLISYRLTLPVNGKNRSFTVDSYPEWFPQK